LISMSQEALETYIPALGEEGTLMIDTGLVETSREGTVGLPATEIAEENVGIKQVANIVMLGYFTAMTEYVTKNSMKEAVEKLVPEGTEEKNLEAFDLGYEQGEEDR
ncbi:MAG: 2-oxoacid:acceptor oxidoreductase family protein, partial [Candidatus Thermoplasmatota archaeon]